MDCVADILAIHFAGNYAADAGKFERINAFLARPDVTPGERYQAEYHASVNGMGEHFQQGPDDEYFEDPDNFR